MRQYMCQERWVSVDQNLIIGWRVSLNLKRAPILGKNPVRPISHDEFVSSSTDEHAYISTNPHGVTYNEVPPLKMTL